MRIIRDVLRVYNWTFEAILSALAIGVAVLALLSHQAELKIGWLPWSGARLMEWLLGLGALGLISVLLAMSGKLRWLVFLFSVAALVLLARGLFFTPYTFADPGECKRAIELVAGAALAAIGAWPQQTRKARY